MSTTNSNPCKREIIVKSKRNVPPDPIDIEDNDENQVEKQQIENADEECYTVNFSGQDGDLFSVDISCNALQVFPHEDTSTSANIGTGTTPRKKMENELYKENILNEKAVIPALEIENISGIRSKGQYKFNNPLKSNDQPILNISIQTNENLNHQPTSTSVCTNTYINKSAINKDVTEIPMTKDLFACDKSDNKSLALNDSKDVKTHADYQLFICNECGYTCRIVDDIENHMNTHAVKGQFVCDKRDCVCWVINDLKDHIKNPQITNQQQSYVSNDIVPHAYKKPFNCNMCEYECDVIRDLTKHIKTHNVKKLHPPQSGYHQSYETINFTEKTVQKICVCGVCDNKSNSKQHSKVHLREKTHAVKEQFLCGKRDCVRPTVNNLKNHIKNQHITNQQQSSTGNDIVTKVNKKLFSCNKCKYECDVIRDLTKHVKTHDVKALHPIEISYHKYYETRKFTEKTVQKVYACSVCDYQSNNKQHLKAHLKEH